jgi:hypothetical protein
MPTWRIFDLWTGLYALTGQKSDALVKPIEGNFECHVEWHLDESTVAVKETSLLAACQIIIAYFVSGRSVSSNGVPL